MKKEKHECSGRAYNPNGSWGNKYRPCTLNAVLNEGGKWWCRTHAPSVERERREKANKKWQQEYEQKKQAAESAKRCQRIGQAVLRAIQTLEGAQDNGCILEYEQRETLEYLRKIVEEATG